MKSNHARQSFPAGIIAILILVGLGIVVFLNGLLSAPYFQLGPVILSGFGAVALKLASLVILSAVFYGVLKRMAWARKLAIGWYAVSAALLLVNFGSFLRNKAMYGDSYRGIVSPEALSGESMSTFLFLGFLIGIIINLLVIKYLVGKRNFFVN